jgi:DNA-binding SARP family transcriptional activator
MISLRTFGGAVLLEDGRVLQGAPVQRRRLALLALLAASGERGVSRDRAMALLWEESDADRARHNLAQLLHILQRDLGPEPVLTGGSDLRLSPGTIRSDVEEFASVCAKGDFAAAIALYTGPFLDGFHLDGAPEFERWVERERARLAGEHASALETLARAAEAAGEFRQAAAQWRRLLAEDPLSARVTVLLMNALAAAGDPAEAIRQAEAHSELMRRELDAAPDRSVLEIADRIRTEPTAAPVPDPPSVAARILAPPSAHAPAGRRRLLPLLAGGAAMLTAAVLLRARTPSLDRSSILVAVFENQTGDSSLTPLGEIAADYISRGIGQTRLAHAVYDARAEASEPAPYTAVSVRESRHLAQRVGAGTLVLGSYSVRGDSLHFEARLLDAASGRILQSLAPAVGPRTDPTAVIELTRQRVMAGFAVLLGPGFQAWQAQSRPPTYEAYLEVLASDELLWTYEWDTAMEHLERAIRLDSSYTGAKTRAAKLNAHLKHCSAVDSIAGELGAIRERLPPLERGQLDWAVADCRGDWRAALEASRTALEHAPASFSFIILGTISALEMGHPHEALAMLDRLPPGDREALRGDMLAHYWDFRSMTLTMMGDHERALEAARTGLRLLPRSRYTAFLMEEAYALAHLGRINELMGRVADWPNPEFPVVPNRGEMLFALALQLRSAGQDSTATRVLGMALEWFSARPPELSAAIDEWISLSNVFAPQYYAGQFETTRAIYEGVLRRDSTRIIAHAALGALAARRGDLAEVRREDLWLAAHVHRGGFATHGRARIAFLLGQRARAVELLHLALDQGFGRLTLTRDPDLARLRGYRPYDDLVRNSE